LKLPQADIKSPFDQTEPIVINITTQNEIFLKEKPKTLSDLRTEIQTLIAFNKLRPVIVRADKSVIFDRVVQVLDVAKKRWGRTPRHSRRGETTEMNPTPERKKPLNDFLFPISSVFT
jgi:biopolymer transport protein ExbD